MIEEKQYITFETAKLAKEKGFTQFGGRYYTKDGNGPFGYISECDVKDGFPCVTQSLLARWIREKHNIHIDSYHNASGYLYYINKTNGTLVYDSDFDGPNDGGAWNSYKEAMESGLQEALKII